ncbi:MAG TPA: Fe2+-dependent dioxygenase [Stellaceae bacterium]|nr:Fe2+-dependent dioxygenase [Stellaceae bacterium]
MLLHIPNILSPAQIAEFRDVLSKAEWVDGRETAGHHSERVKRNRQLAERHPAARQLGAVILAALDRSALFLSAALPLRIVPPLFNRYEGGETYGNHVDGAVRPVPGSPLRVRTDLSATVFLSAPEDYDGGDLVVDDTFGAHRVKLPAGSMILYPGSSLHRVDPVTRGMRLAAFFWIESMVRDDGERRLLFDLDRSVQEIAGAVPDSPAVAQLYSVYHNLLRRWADT